MAGLGETEEEVFETMDDLREAGCEVFTIGQYLQPTKRHLEVKEFVPLEIFEKYRKAGLKKGFSFVESSPLVRSSYHAERHVIEKSEIHPDRYRDKTQNQMTKSKWETI